MIENIRKDKTVGMEGEMHMPLFKDDISVYFPDRSKLTYAEKCAAYLNNMNEDMLNRLKKYIYRYYREYADQFDEDELGMPVDVEEEDILRYVSPGALIIEKDCREKMTEFHLEFECDWEIEHGLEITISNGKILYVGSFDDMPPYDAKRLKAAGFFDPNASVHLNYADHE